MRKRYFLLVSGGLLLLLLISGAWARSSRSMQNYADADGPKFEGQYADGEPGEFDGRIKVIAWNIAFSREIDTAVAELRTVPGLQDADILLLQEMDEVGVETIAKALKTNYVYYPASIHSENGKNFGNAILSKWPISQPAKLLLPHKNPSNGQTRTATRTIVTIDGQDVLTYSVHTETAWLSPAKRREQVEFLLNDAAGQGEALVVMGGDFNTLTPPGVAALTEQMAGLGLERVSAGAGPTVIKGELTFVPDHIFARGWTAVQNGTWPETEASDHFPLWVVMALQEGP